MSTYDEVVTDCKVRYVDLPGVGEVALLTLDNGLDHTTPSSFGPTGLTRIDTALDGVAARAPQVKAIALTGKPFVFAVGADLKAVGQAADTAQAREIGQLGHRVFARFRDAKVPTFALVNGVALGGGLEIALHCHYRTISTGVTAVGLPECFLGLVPGWGGTQLLPALIGADRAVTVVIENPLNTNRMLNGRQAHERGIADAAFEPADFLEQSLAWVAGVLRGEVVVSRTEPDRGPAWDAAITRGRTLADAKVGGAAPAPYRALDLLALARTAPFADGTAAEDEALTELIFSAELRAGLYAFDLVRKRAKHPVGAPDRALARPVAKVGVVGAGLMATQLALLFVRRLEVPVVLTDLDAERLDRGVAGVRREIDTLLAGRRLSSDKANRLKRLVTGSLSKDAFADADLVIEAVFEELALKQKIFAEIEEVVSPQCLLATNTSALSVSEMAAGLRHPERVVGLHFFNPVAVLPLLEVVRAEQTDEASLATAFVVAATLKKSAVLVADRPAFVVNRLLTRFLGEVTRAVDEGMPFLEADRALAPLGLPMSPFVLLALVGPAVALHVAETLSSAFPGRFTMSDGLRAMVAAGKTGVYTWGPEGQAVDPEVAAMFDVADRSSAPTPEQLRGRALGAMAEEIRHLLDEGVVAAPQDVDLCLLLGAGWPFHLGGITPYLDRSGVAERVTGSRFLPPGVASVS